MEEKILPIRKRYDDMRTRQGKKLAQVIEGITKDLGGEESLNKVISTT